MNEERFCKDCKHFTPNPKAPLEIKVGKCVQLVTYSLKAYLVSGDPKDILEGAEYAVVVRAGRCGPSGRFWEPAYKSAPLPPPPHAPKVEPPPQPIKMPWWKRWCGLIRADFSPW